jgi:UDP-2,3-diacylglucosamine hydrolase
MQALAEIPLAPGTLCIADLHLDVGAEDGGRDFVRFLATLSGVPRLVILGDLFDVWVGPAQATMPGAPAVLDALRALVEKGTTVDLVPGNRDFLLDRSFAERTSVRLHAEGFVGTLGPRRILFVHGDTLCTRDHAYQRLRRVLRSKPVGWLAPRVPLAIGTRVARRLRRASVRAVAAKLPDEKSIQREAVIAAARAERCGTLVCGHAHVFRDEMLEGDLRFLVLDAFGGTRDVLHFAEDDVRAGSSRAVGR